jgi:hypothetical protein
LLGSSPSDLGPPRRSSLEGGLSLQWQKTSSPASDAGFDCSGTKQESKKNVIEQLDQFIFAEFQRIKSTNNLILKKAERNSKAAEREVKYWNNLVSVWERRNERSLEGARQRQAEAMHKEVFGGKTIIDLLHEIDNRLPAIV